jgi:hypothetical protein
MRKWINQRCVDRENSIKECGKRYAIRLKDSTKSRRVGVKVPWKTSSDNLEHGFTVAEQ